MLQPNLLAKIEFLLHSPDERSTYQLSGDAGPQIISRQSEFAPGEMEGGNPEKVEEVVEDDLPPAFLYSFTPCSFLFPFSTLPALLLPPLPIRHSLRRFLPNALVARASQNELSEFEANARTESLHQLALHQTQIFHVLVSNLVRF